MAIQVLVLHRFHLLQLCLFCENIYQQCPDPKESDKHVQELRVHMLFRRKDEKDQAIIYSRAKDVQTNSGRI
jgi:hypothetical protein